MELKDHIETLKLEAKIVDSQGGSFNLRFPVSRIHRDLSKVGNVEVLEGFHGRIQAEYNLDPVGQYAGPYDQNAKLDLTLQLPDSDLNFENYTEFNHSCITCHTFAISESYDDYADLHKLDALELKSEENSDDDSEGSNNEEEDDKIYYTCENGECCIPCPCSPCCKGEEQCTEHWIQHQDLFDEENDTVVARSTDTFCRDESFFTRSYLLKYSGIPSKCRKCNRDVVHHNSYHLDFHQNCKYCMQNWFKLYPETAEEFIKKQKKEDDHFKTVCPHCDKMFQDQYARNKHIEFEHQKRPYTCDHCEKTFHAKQSKDYHELIYHTKSQHLEKCNICDKTFAAKVTLRNHQKYVHSEVRKYKCDECNGRFKQQKDLTVHNLNVHGINQQKETYHRPEKQVTHKCDVCESTYIYKKDLYAHKRLKHNESPKEVFQCEQCPSKFKQKISLNAHIKTKHGNEQYPCPSCGKVFKQKNNMKRHKRMHGEDQ